jgi:hypothetical protein
VALNAAERIIRLGSCKRSAVELVRDLPVFCGHIERSLRQFPEYAGWRVERVSLASHVIERQRSLVQDLNDLTGGLSALFTMSLFPRPDFACIWLPPLENIQNRRKIGPF